jgi:hypothetical protein
MTDISPDTERQAGSASHGPLGDVQREFPGYLIWREVTGAREARYVARARNLSAGLHTVMTSDLAELRHELTVAAAVRV